MSLPSLIVGTRHCRVLTVGNRVLTVGNRVLTVGNINSDATGIDITGKMPVPRFGELSSINRAYFFNL